MPPGRHAGLASTASGLQSAKSPVLPEKTASNARRFPAPEGFYKPLPDKNFRKKARKPQETVNLAGFLGVRGEFRSFFPTNPRNVPAHESVEVHLATQMTKSQLIEKISDATELTKRDVKGVLESLATLGYKELKKAGMFTVPGFAKFVVVKKPATKARKGINPFTGEPTTFKAKPARKIVRARPVKAAKDAV